MKIAITILSVFIISFYANGQNAGNLDSTFGINGVQSYQFASCDSRPNSIHLYNGSVYLGGYLKNSSDCSNGIEKGGIAKLDSFGMPDNSFNSNGITASQNMYWPHSVLNPITGQLILTGYDRSSPSSDFAASRIGFNANGELDTTFNSGIVSIGTNDNERMRGNAISSSTGEFITVGYTEINEFLVAKFLSNGNLDSSFGLAGFAIGIPPNFNGGRAFAGHIQSDGKVVVAGGVGGNNPNSYGLIRYNTDGSLDTNFGLGGYVTINNLPSSTFHRVTGLGQQIDGKLVGVGYWNDSGDDIMSVFRLNTDGSLDNSFGTNGLFTYNTPGATLSEEVAIQDDGKIVANVYDNNNNNQILIFRLNDDGTLDSTFANNGIADWTISGYSQIWVKDIGVMNNGIYAVGSADFGGQSGLAFIVKLKINSTMNATAPLAGFTFSTNGTEISFVDTSTNNPTNWLWNFGNGDTSILQNPIYDYGQSGSYNVTLIASNAMGSDTIQRQISVVSSLKSENSSQVQLFPNPASEQVTLSGLEVLNLKISLFNSFGQEVKANINAENKKVIIDTRQIPSGLYILKVTDGEKTFTEKVLIKR